MVLKAFLCDVDGNNTVSKPKTLIEMLFCLSNFPTLSMVTGNSIHSGTVDDGEVVLVCSSSEWGEDLRELTT